MSDPRRLLNHRKLPPLNNIHYRWRDNFISHSIPEKLFSETFSTNDQISPQTVIQYLLNNPQFVESFLLKYYSSITLKEILVKMDNEYSEIVFVPKCSIIVSQNKSQSDTLYGSTNKTREGYQEYPQCLISKDSRESFTLNSSIIDNRMLYSPDQMKSLFSQITRKTSTNFIENDENKSQKRICDKQILSQDTLNKRYLVFGTQTYSSETELDIEFSSLEIINDLKNDLIPILHCDGANLYMIDHLNKLVYLNGVTRISSQNIEKGTTLAAFVAHENVCVNTQDIFMDERFPRGILINNPLIKSAIAQPINLQSGVPIGVLEFHRSSDKVPFSKKDEEVMRNYTTWASLAIYYNQINIDNQKQQKLNQFILKVTQKMFCKLKNIDLIIKDIMASAKSLVKADRVSLFLRDKDTNELYARIFDNGTFEECIFETKDVIRLKIGEGIAGYVAETGLTLNIQDAYGDERFNRGIDNLTGYITKTILCMPVKLNNEIIGVVQMLNKLSGVFTVNDEKDFETFATYCGMAIHISKMYEKILRSQKKYKVALDVLSYHSGYSEEEFQKLKITKMPDNIPNIEKLSFWPWTVDYQNQPLYVIYMFKDLFGLETCNVIDRDDFSYSGIDRGFDGETLMRFVLTVQKNYRIVPYHNWNHAFSVAHSMYALLKNCTYNFNILESLALFIGCLCHDLDHRGKTNQYMLQNSAPLSDLYSTSTMEHHHFNMTVTILQRDGHNIFSHLSSANYKTILGNIKHCILATDLTKYLEYRHKIECTPNFTDNEIYSNRLLHMAISMTFCDLCSMYKSWDIQLAVVMIIMKEFWNQGDEEKLKGHVPIKMMDRDFQLELPECQVGFLKFICIPCYTLLGSIIPEVSSVVIEAKNNLEKWAHLAALTESEKAVKLHELDIYVQKVMVDYSLHV